MFVGNLLNGVAATMDTKAAPPISQAYLATHIYVFLLFSIGNDVLESIVLHVYIFVSQE